MSIITILLPIVRVVLIYSFRSMHIIVINNIVLKLSILLLVMVYLEKLNKIFIACSLIVYLSYLYL